MEKHKISTVARKGSVIIFDSLLFHRAGINISNKTRVGLNHVFSQPIIRPQYDISKSLPKDLMENPFYSMVFGFDFETMYNDIQWRKFKDAQRN